MNATTNKLDKTAYGEEREELATTTTKRREAVDPFLS